MFSHSSGVTVFSVLLSGDGLCDRKYPAGLTCNTKEGDVKTEGDFRDRKVEMVNQQTLQQGKRLTTELLTQT
jgi:hypothetical protein